MERGKRNLTRNNRSIKEPPLIIKPPKKPDHEYKRRGLLGEVCKLNFLIFNIFLLMYGRVITSQAYVNCGFLMFAGRFWKVL